MKTCFSLILSLLLIASLLSLTGCKEKKEPAMVDIESIDVNGSHNDKYIFREELKKEQEKRAKREKLEKEMSE